jgi:putative effector of murein hydrolase LrgA (UPF0299 family)
MITIKEALQLLFVPVFVGVHGKRNAAGAFRFPVDGLFAHGISSNFLIRIMRKAAISVNRN